MKIFLVLLLVTAASWVKAQELNPCERDAKKFGNGLSWELLKKSDYLALNHHLGELEPVCQQFLAKELAEKDLCVMPALKHCPGKEANRDLRKNCLFKHAEDIKLGCFKKELETCGNLLQLQCRSSKLDSACAQEMLKALPRYCQQLIKPDTALYIAQCAAPLGSLCGDRVLKLADNNGMWCLSFHNKKVSDGCFNELVRLSGEKSLCYPSVLQNCYGEDFKRKNRPACLLKNRSKLPRVCKNEMKYNFLVTNCARKEHPGCLTSDDLIGCIKKSAAPISENCQNELKLFQELDYFDR